MNALHAKALRSFAHRVEWLFLLRAAVKGATIWLLFWGVVALAVRFSSTTTTARLALGLLGVLPVGIAAGWHARKQIPAFAKIRATFDRLNACGGVIMSEEAADMSHWQSLLPPTTAPTVRWHGTKALLSLSIAAIFAITTLLLPDRLTHLSFHRPLEVGQISDQLQAEVQVLHQEKIVDDKKADDLQKQLSQIKQDSSGYDPDKTWEALDHIKEANADAAKQAAEEAQAKTSAMTDAQSVAQAMDKAADAGMDQATAAQAAQELAKMLAAAKLDDGLLNVDLPAGLSNDLNGLSKEQLQKLANSLQSKKDLLAKTMGNLAAQKLIDGGQLGQMLAAGKNGDPDALIAYLSKNPNAVDMASLEQCLLLGKGGPGGGGPPAPMTWSDPKSEENQKFKEHVLPPAGQISDAQLVGVSRAAPQVSDAAISAGHGALDSASQSGGSAHEQVVLPEQRQAVRNFFNRDGQ